MVVKKTDLQIFEGSWISYGVSLNKKVWGVCLFDKYCYTNVFGFEILK